MSSSDYPVTQAVRLLREKNVQFEPFQYAYEEHGGTRVAAAALHVDEHAMIKTLVFESDQKKPLLVLMHGDREVSAKQFARVIGAKQVLSCDPQSAQRHTGYMVGGISPFGTRSSLPVYVEKSILPLPVIYINGGKRGFLIKIIPAVLVQLLNPIEVEVGIAQ